MELGFAKIKLLPYYRIRREIPFSEFKVRFHSRIFPNSQRLRRFSEPWRPKKAEGKVDFFALNQVFS